MSVIKLTSKVSDNQFDSRSWEGLLPTRLFACVVFDDDAAQRGAFLNHFLQSDLEGFGGCNIAEYAVDLEDEDAVGVAIDLEGIGDGEIEIEVGASEKELLLVIHLE